MDKKLNYKVGAIKRKLGIKKGDKVETGDLIRKANELKAMNPRKRTAFAGMI